MGILWIGKILILDYMGNRALYSKFNYKNKGDYSAYFRELGAGY